MDRSNTGTEHVRPCGRVAASQPVRRHAEGHRPERFVSLERCDESGAARGPGGERQSATADHGRRGPHGGPSAEDSLPPGGEAAGAGMASRRKDWRRAAAEGTRPGEGSPRPDDSGVRVQEGEGRDGSGAVLSVNGRPPRTAEVVPASPPGRHAGFPDAVQFRNETGQREALQQPTEMHASRQSPTRVAVDPTWAFATTGPNWGANGGFVEVRWPHEREDHKPLLGLRASQQGPVRQDAASVERCGITTNGDYSRAFAESSQ
jgi:hypothetical protein